ncbi:MAG: tRNA pseudouridine(38-40) synthase TruA [Candidatus Thiodiazotropha lotti]|uniref:tRNA pseudouridine synthase A n=1 Tax=Candidatus Thiodiazotropha endoloripes TaxID=1818881 RepID=A0A1E2UU39_9GAMM|nr:tRNA pseudouridine(38-40) synthase TruA [Candidatus Thiodiazotropha endoloripes]MCG7897085.1 tRNA pseudouridine(38-40) synthase TruA [Candidatus Thiodiazotropha weberae]MCG7991139.1 tRNA pseudouridine(38-40) synthase TruA [Candidatus Thiodiazotropha lotti]MCG7902952.1 tRNA pseudouridine(38-40) synthase TruA [Candidatus Thiodiazotropha weberae]MCG8001349.1 tRNA pseudouridine(38-40) synthase TruA [Candidatus Thiodiazotropha lotti]MCW4182794.1 tRNA pseudouridine(38-40) synthase TruA [Candidatu
MRVALGVEYDGTAFHGWQFQGDVRSVQESLQIALSKVADHEVTVHCAGRTDTGVHATGQIVHFDTPSIRTERSWVLGTNVNLPADVSVCWAKQMPEEFHARFSAIGRHYRYLILNRTYRSALWRDRAVWVHKPLDEQVMHRAAQYLVGTHDFSSYRALGCQAKHPVRTMHSLSVTRQGEMLSIDVHANAFLHHMVRNIAGVLIAIGKGEQSESWADEILALRDRTLGGVTAPPQGLCLTQVDYPEEFALG